VVLTFLAVVISTFLESLRLPLQSLTSLAISEAGAAVKYDIYLRENVIKLWFQSTDQSRVELATRLLRPADVDAEVRKKGGRDIWRIDVTTDRLAAGCKELRKALAEIVRATVENGWVDAGMAERWLEKLERGAC
jgi:L-asparaginase II